jgi:hypothetical protein
MKTSNLLRKFVTLLMEEYEETIAKSSEDTITSVLGHSHLMGYYNGLLQTLLLAGYTQDDELITKIYSRIDAHDKGIWPKETDNYAK